MSPAYPVASPMSDHRIHNKRAAKRYVYNVVASMLENEFNLPDFNEGWMFGGIEDKDEKRRIATAVRELVAEMTRRGSRG